MAVKVAVTMTLMKGLWMKMVRFVLIDFNCMGLGKLRLGQIPL